jgi:heat shock protein HslJ
MYACPGGTDFAAVFSKDGDLATLTVPGQPQIELSRQHASSGFAYGDSYYELRGRGREATLTAAGRSMRCHAAGRPGEPPRTYQGGGFTVTLFPDGIFRLRELHDGVEPVPRPRPVGPGGRRRRAPGLARRRGGAARVPRGRWRAADRRGWHRTCACCQADLIDGRFQLAGLYRDTQSGGLFAECLTGRTFAVAPVGAEADLERAWTERRHRRRRNSTSRSWVTLPVARSRPTASSASKRDGACAPLAPRGSALRGTEWRVLEIDADRPTFDDWRRRPTLRLDDQGKYAASTGCNSLSGSYQLDPDGLRFLGTTTTLMGCAAPASDIERRFLDALSAVRQAQIAGITLDLLDASGKRRLRLEARGR